MTQQTELLNFELILTFPTNGKNIIRNSLLYEVAPPENFGVDFYSWTSKGDSNKLHSKASKIREILSTGTNLSSVCSLKIYQIKKIEIWSDNEKEK